MHSNQKKTSNSENFLVHFLATGLILYSSSSFGSRSVPWLGEGLSMSPNYPALCYPLPYRVAPVFVQVVSPPLGWSHLSSFLVIYGLQAVTREVHRSSLRRLIYPAQDHVSHSVDYIYDFCPLPDPDVGFSFP